VYARRDELEILRLVGATDSYILTPFVIEGALEGALASAVALVVLQAVHRGVLARLHDAVPVTFVDQGFQFLPAGPVVALVGLGIGIGVGGSWVAVRRFLARLA
jgi:cell division transport system permease protein